MNTRNKQLSYYYCSANTDSSWLQLLSFSVNSLINIAEFQGSTLFLSDSKPLLKFAETLPFTYIQEFNYKIKDVPTIPHLGRIGIYKLDIYKKYDSIMYVDSDLVFTSSWKSIFENQTPNSNWFVFDKRDNYRNNNINSGLFSIRKDSVTKYMLLWERELRASFRKNSKFLSTYDQPFLNDVLNKYCDDWICLPKDTIAYGPPFDKKAVHIVGISPQKKFEKVSLIFEELGFDV